MDRPGGGTGDGPGWPTSGIEMEALFGAVAGREFARDWAAYDGPDLVATGESDIDDLYAGDAAAEDVANRMSAALAGVGFTAQDFPQLHGRVNARGQGMLMMGGISLDTAEVVIAELVALRRRRRKRNRPAKSGREIRPAAESDGAAPLVIGVELEGRELG
jgi:hypothetical protein